MDPPRVRNPLAGFVLAILVAMLLSGIAGYGITYIPYLEFRLFALGVSLFAIGAFAGRRTYLGMLGFMGGYLGSFVGFYVAELFFWVNPELNAWFMWLALVFALAAGFGGFVTGKLGVRALDRASQYHPGLRRCSNCGARVGNSARKCWTCKATLTY